MSLQRRPSDADAIQTVLLDLKPVFEAEILRREGRHAKAESKYKEGLASFPERSGGRVLILNKLGVLYEEMQEPRRAFEAYQQAADEGSMTPFTYLQLGKMALAEGHYSASIRYCGQGIEAMKRAPIELLAELYFRFAFQRLRRKAARTAARARKAAG